MGDGVEAAVKRIALDGGEQAAAEVLSAALAALDDALAASPHSPKS